MKVLKRHIEKSFMSSLTVFVLTVGVRCGGGGEGGLTSVLLIKVMSNEN